MKLRELKTLLNVNPVCKARPSESTILALSTMSSCHRHCVLLDQYLGPGLDRVFPSDNSYILQHNVEDPMRNKDSVFTFSGLSSVLAHSLEFVMVCAEPDLSLC